MSSLEHLPVLQVFSFLVLGFLFPMLYCSWRKWMLVLGLVVTGFNWLIAFALLRYVLAEGSFSYHMGNWPPPWGIELYLDPFGAFMNMVITTVAVAVVFYALVEPRKELAPAGEPNFFALVFLLLASLQGITFTRDLFNMFVFFEICSVASCGIVVGKGKGEAFYASLKYLILSTLGSGCILLAIAIIYTVTGNLNMVYIQTELTRAVAQYPLNVALALGLITTGFSVKAALFPLHVWLPDAHGYAPSQASALLSALVVKIYAFALIRVYFVVFPRELLYSIPVGNILLLFGTLAVLIGSLFAMGQRDLKRLLAYSTVAQMGYIFLGLGLMTAAGLIGGMFQILNHALVKSFLFLAAGNMITQTGVRQIDEMEGMGRRMPLTMGIFTVGALSMVGLPGFSGFITKLQLGMASLEAGRPVVILVLLASSLFNAFYYLPVVIKAFFGSEKYQDTTTDEVGLDMLLPIILLALASIGVGLFPQAVLELLEGASQILFEGGH